MIYFDSETYGLTAPIQICRDFAKKFKQEKMALGRYELENGIYCTAIECDSAANEKDFFEAHKKYVDIHYSLSEEFCVAVGFLSKMTAGEYQPEKDFLSVSGNAGILITLKPDTGLCLFPNDAHCIKESHASSGKKVRKIIFKVPLELF